MGFMQTRVHASRTPTILYVDYLHKDALVRNYDWYVDAGHGKPFA